MKLDRKLQKEILEVLAENHGKVFTDNGALKTLTTDKEALFSNLRYLEGHGLIVSGMGRNTGGWFFLPKDAWITHHGLDFLSDDGGLSSVLGVVTVKFHADTVRDLIEARIAAMPAPEHEKKRVIDHLRSLPADALRILTTRLIEWGVDQMPDALPALRKLLDP